jgi:2-desacetyl-2-hydroxyethyl bacteriochlorophyllide A dehydrogenase
MPQRIVFPEKSCVELQRFSLPDVGEGDLHVRTLYSLMSIGTETAILHQNYAPGTHFDRLFSYPQLKTGVQAIAIVEEVGPGVSEFDAGDRVFMRMAHGSHQVIPAAACSRVPEGIASDSGCWCGLAKTAYRAAWAGRFDQADSILVVGAGPVGQMTVRWANTLGTREVVVCDLAENRLEHAILGGATQALVGPLDKLSSKIKKIYSDEGPQLIVDTTGSPTAFAQILGAAGRFGVVLILGDTGFPGEQCLTSDVMTKGLTIRATHDSHDIDGWTQRRIDELFFDSVLGGRFNLDELITHRFDPSDCEQAYRLASDNREQAIGILYDWSKLS